MKSDIVEVPSIQKPIQPSPGFEKKGLGEEKLDLGQTCEFKCLYCSSDYGMHNRTRLKVLDAAALIQLGRLARPVDKAATYAWPDVLDRLRAQLERVPAAHGQGKTLVVSMLTDAFSPYLLANGTTEKALRMVLEKTRYRIRILTKNSVIGTPTWIRFFQDHAERFVVGLSVGGLDPSRDWIEDRTPNSRSRLKALRALQDAGVCTYGMLCPVFPDVLDTDELERLLDEIRPERCQHVWAEPYNDRQNWRRIFKANPEAVSARRLKTIYETKDAALWSEYAVNLYERLSSHAQRHAWSEKLRYLLYEASIDRQHAHRLGELRGIYPQSPTDDCGLSKNAAIAEVQRRPLDASGNPVWIPAACAGERSWLAQSLRAHIERHAPPTYGGKIFRQWLLERGRVYLAPGAALTDAEMAVLRTALDISYLKPRVGYCYYNAQQVAFHDPSGLIKYVEGIAQFCGIEMDHAWLELNGKVVDLTWPRTELGAMGCFEESVLGLHSREYLGVPLERDVVRRYMDETGVSGESLLFHPRYSPVSLMQGQPAPDPTGPVA